MHQPIQVKSVSPSLSAVALAPSHIERLSVSAQLNAELAELRPVERLARIIMQYPERSLITTSGGVQSRVLPTLLAKVGALSGMREFVRNLPVVLIDTGDLFPESVGYAARMRRKCDLNVLKVRNALSSREFDYNVTLLVDSGLHPDDARDELTKVRPMRALLAQSGRDIWIAGNRRDQAPSRAVLPFADVLNDVIKIYPLADQTAADIQELNRQYNIAPHPLADRFASIGNRLDTKPSNGTFEKSGRHNGRKEECGLHTQWARDGATFILDGNVMKPVPNMPIQIVAIGC